MPNIDDIMEIADAVSSKSVVCAPARCVRVRNRNARCSHCVDACPTSAITVEDNEITVDHGACVGCGACLAVCPNQALVSCDPLDEELARSVASATKAAGQCVIACARKAARHEGVPERFAEVPCLARMEEGLLCALAARGVDSVTLVDGHCATCKYRDAIPYLDDTIASAESLLESVGGALAVERTSEFPDAVQVEGDSQGHRDARRRFFTDAGSYAKDVAMAAAEKTLKEKLAALKGEEAPSLRKLLGVRSGAGTMPVIEAERNMAILDDLSRIGEPVEDEMFTRVFGSVAVDAEQCDGCGMCMLFCPTGALRKSVYDHPDSQRQFMEFQAADCTQCNLCADVCRRQCLSVEPVVSTEELFDFEPRLIDVPKRSVGGRKF